jgi:5-methylcytosine-specific restriction enzyme B
LLGKENGMGVKLDTDEALKAALNGVLASSAASKTAQDWYTRVAAFLAQVRAGLPDKLEDIAFLQQLWDDESISATGNGTVKMAPALGDGEFRRWFAEQVKTPLPADGSPPRRSCPSSTMACRSA